jgi:hypothetical protein
MGKACRAFLDDYNDDNIVERRILQARAMGGGQRGRRGEGGAPFSRARAQGGDVAAMTANVCQDVCGALEEDDRHAVYIHNPDEHAPTGPGGEPGRGGGGPPPHQQAPPRGPGRGRGGKQGKAGVDADGEPLISFDDE